MDDRGQYVAYTFYRADPAWRRLPIEDRAAAKDSFADRAMLRLFNAKVRLTRPFRRRGS